MAERIVLPPPGYVQDDDAVARYGIIENVQTYDDILDPTALKARAEADLADQLVINPQIEVNAVDLENIEGAQHFTVGKKYRLISPSHGHRTGYVILQRTEEHLLSPEQSVYTFGAVTNGLTKESARVNRSMNAVAMLAANTAADAAEMLNRITELETGLEGIANYVTSEATTDGWRTRTWNDGKVDAWSVKSLSFSNWSGGQATATVTLPTGITTGTIIQITGDQVGSFTGAIASGVLTVTAKAATNFASATTYIFIGG